MQFICTKEFFSNGCLPDDPCRKRGSQARDFVLRIPKKGAKPSFLTFMKIL